MAAIPGDSKTDAASRVTIALYPSCASQRVRGWRRIKSKSGRCRRVRTVCVKNGALHYELFVVNYRLIIGDLFRLKNRFTVFRYHKLYRIITGRSFPDRA
jgi:hypothetical protein